MADMIPSGRSIDSEQIAVLELLADLVAVAIARGQIVDHLRVAVEESNRGEEAEAQAREQLEYLFENLGTVFYVIDQEDARRSRMSRNCFDVYGYEPVEFLDNPDLWTTVVEPTDRIEFAKYYEQSTGSDIPIRYRIKRRDGTTRWVESHVKKVFDSSGRLVRIHGLTEDISSRVSLEERLRESQKMEAIGQLAGGVAHDFNNLLTVITGHAAMLLDDLPSDTTAHDSVQQIAAAESAASLTRQLLAFSRRQMIAPQVVDLNSTVDHLSKMLHRLIGEDITLTTSLKNNLGLAKVDPGQIEQIVLNLATNARDAMPSGGKLTIETANVEIDQEFADSHKDFQSGPHVMLAITDRERAWMPRPRFGSLSHFLRRRGLEKGPVLASPWSTDS